MRSISLALFIFLFLSLNGYATIPTHTSNPPVILWQIGIFDDDNKEFQFFPDQFHRYRNPGIHVEGITDPKKSWPYILPGPLDLWAGSGPHTFVILFQLNSVEQHGIGKLIIDFLDTHSFKPPKIQVKVNDNTFEHQTGIGNNDWLMSAQNNSGKEHIASFSIPLSSFKVGENRIQITVLEGAYALWDAIRLEAPPGVSLGEVETGTYIRAVEAKPVLVKGKNGLLRPIILDVLHIGNDLEARINVSGLQAFQVSLSKGRQKIELLIPEISDTEKLQIEFYSGNKVIASTSKVIDPARKWEIHLIHQTHLDIGFTHTQEEVLKMQTDYLYQALDLIEKTKDYPQEARFKWHAEGMWAIDEFLRTAPEEKKKQFIKALHEQSIHLDAFYVHLLTGLATGEELFELIQPAKNFEQAYDVPVKTAIGSDVPGYSWGLVTALANQGIEFFNMAPNNNHRLGYLYQWADKPFYWLSPCGQHKVFTWMASHAYIYFWEQDASLEKVPRFLEYLEDRDFQYNIAMLRYEVGGDNGYPDPRLADRVKEWNEKYAYPKIIISTNSQLYQSFIERYEDQIPLVSGDLTPYWEDGATSTSADLGLSRRAGERLLQAQILQAILKPGLDLQEQFNTAWNNILMYDEHTWGAWSSISDPFGSFVVQQEQYKQKFALDANEQTLQLMDNITMNYTKTGSGVIDVYNTSSWMRNDLVMLTPNQSVEGDILVNDQNNPVPSQRLASGELVFWVEDVPAFGARRYWIKEGEPEQKNVFDITDQFISNDKLHLEIDKGTGSISSIIIKKSGYELVDPTSHHQLNDYVYVLGRDENTDWHGIEPPLVCTIEDNGPLVGTLCIESRAAGCKKLTRRIRLLAGQNRIEIINTVDKDRVLDPEGVYFTFPFNIPDGHSRIDIPWGVIRPETDQLEGANRNYYPVQRWLDISNDNIGVTWVTIDAPMIKFDPIRIIGKGRGDSYAMAEFGMDGIRKWWNRSIYPSQTFYSWVMSNHWEVNYKAYQEGEITYRYVLFPHENGYNGSVAERMGRDICQPLIAVEADESTSIIQPYFTVESQQVIVTSIRPSHDGKGQIIRFYNTGSDLGMAHITFTGNDSYKLQYCDNLGYPTGPAEKIIELAGYGVKTLKIEKL